MTATREGAPARPATDALACFIDRQRPVTAAEQAAWKLYLSLHRDHMRAARIAFRQVCAGEAPEMAIISFVGESAISDPAVAEMEEVLKRLAAEEPR